MSNVELTLKEAMEIDGAVAVALVDYGSGMSLGALGGGGCLDLDVAAAGNTEVIRAKLRTMHALNLNDQIEDILITLGSQYHLIRLLQSASGQGPVPLPGARQEQGQPRDGAPPPRHPRGRAHPVSWLSRKGGTGSRRRAAGSTADHDGPADDARPARRGPTTPCRPRRRGRRRPPPVWPAGSCRAEPRQGGRHRAVRRGKTTFVGAVAEPRPASRPRRGLATGRAALKTVTTVSLDFGALDVPDPDGAGAVRVALFGTPGAAAVLVHLADPAEGMRASSSSSTRAGRRAATRRARSCGTFRAMAPDVPFVVAGQPLGRVRRRRPHDARARAAARDAGGLVRADVREHGAGVRLLQARAAARRPRRPLAVTRGRRG
jgi:hypothetical protein